MAMISLPTEREMLSSMTSYISWAIDNKIIAAKKKKLNVM
jgi:hypothetical protein